MNEVVELLADGPGVQEDVPARCGKTNNELLSIGGNEEGVFTAYVERRAVG